MKLPFTTDPNRVSRHTVLQTLGAASAGTTLTAVGSARATAAGGVPPVAWDRTYDARAVAVDRDPNGGYVLAGNRLVGERAPTRYDRFVPWLAKIDEDGVKRWSLTFEAYNQANGQASAVAATTDGFLLGNEVTARAEPELIKVSRANEVEWTLDLSTLSAWADSWLDSHVRSIVPTDDGYAVAGYVHDTFVDQHEICANVSKTPFAAVIDRSGDVAWYRDADLSGGEFHDIVALPGGGYVGAGIETLYECDGDDVRTVGQRPYAARLTESGEVVCQREYGDLTFEAGLPSGEVSVARGYDGGSVLSGPGFLVKVDERGELIWTRTRLRGVPSTMIRSGDARAPGFVLAGATDVERDEFGVQCAGNGWILRTNRDGETLWVETYDYCRSDSFADPVRAHDGCYVLAGSASNGKQTGTLGVKIGGEAGEPDTALGEIDCGSLRGGGVPPAPRSTSP